MADVTFYVDSTETSYFAETVEVDKVWLGKRRQLSDYSNRIYTDGYHLRFRIAGDVIELSTGSNSIRNLQLDLDDNSKTVEVEIDGNRLEVLSTMDESQLYSTEYGGRSDPDLIECITKSKLTRTQVIEFDK